MRQIPKSLQLDAIDRGILSELQADGRLTNQEVADRVNLSPSPCLRRIRQLEESGVIRQYVALLTPEKIGLGLLAYVNVRMEKHSDILQPGSARNTSPSPRPGTCPARPRCATAARRRAWRRDLHRARR